MPLPSSVHQTENLLFSVLVQLILMIGAARIMNTIFRRLGQPGVIGEIVAGLMLGPSLFGHFFPSESVFLFGLKASAPITVISQIGLVLLMFQIGADFEFQHLRKQTVRRAIGLITAASIGVPLALGFAIGHWSAPILAPQIDRLTYSLFCAVALAITAVPILGRILREYGLTHTQIGVTAITAAALNDVIGWVLLAAVTTYAARAFSGLNMGLQISGILALSAVCLIVLRPLIGRLVDHFAAEDEALTPNLMAIVFCLIFALAICTYRLGIFSIFGGFMAGILFHQRPKFVAAWHKQVGQMVLVFFLPVFFTYTGLRTNLLGLNEPQDWLWLTIILIGAIAGKVVPVYFASRLTGSSHYQATILGVLMNTRALMELIVLNIGYDLGVLPQKTFTMLVIMAVVTTLMTGPLLKLLLPKIGHNPPKGLEA